jgi:cell division septation protein DedD
MNALFHSDLLNFGTMVLIIMIIGGVLVALGMIAQSVWSIHRRKADQQDDQTGPIRPKPTDQERKHLPKSA